MRKKAIIFLLCAVLALGVTACGGSGGNDDSDKKAGGETVTLRLSHASPESSTWQTGAEAFKRIVEEKTEGRYLIDIYPMDQLSGGNQVGGIEMLQQGVVDLHMQDGLIWSAVEPKVAAPSFPWIMSSYEEVDKYMEGDGGEAIAELISNSGAVCLGIGESGFRQIINNKRPIHTPEDLSGIKLRVPGIEMYINLFKELGADPVTMNGSEVYTALQQGALDGSENPLDLLVNGRFVEVVKNMTIWNYSYDPIIFSASNKLWDSLSEEDKAIFEEAGQQAMKEQKEASRKMTEDLLPTLDQYDLEVVTLSDDEIKAFQDAVKPIYQQYKDSIGEELFAKFGYTF